MKTYLECIPCFVRQALESARFVSDDATVHERVLREVLRASADRDMHDCPPAMGRRIHVLIKQVTGNGDPYREVKDRFNEVALKLYPELKEKVERSDDRLLAAVEIAIVGNVIDYGAKNSLNIDKEIEKCLIQATTKEWLQIFRYEDIIAGPLNTVDKVMADPQVNHLSMILDIKHSLGGTVKLAGNPIMTASLKGEHSSPPTLGQHTDEVLKELLGYSDDRTRKLKDEQEAHAKETQEHVRKQR